MSRITTIAAAAALVFLCYAALPRIVRALADNQRLQQLLAQRNIELSEARAELAQLRYLVKQEQGDVPIRSSDFLVQRQRIRPTGVTQPTVQVAVQVAAQAEAPIAAATAAAAALPELTAPDFLAPRCRAAWLERRRRSAAQPGPPPHSEPLPFEGGNLERRGVLEAALAVRAPGKELIFLSVGDTRDHRREIKDPALKSISVDFLVNLLANLRQLRIGHYIILTTEPLCRKLQATQCEYACVWTDLWHDHRGLAPWNLKPGDMFLMWAQQWRYIARAMELGYRVLRADTDVYLAEDPYPLFRGPLFAPYSMVVPLHVMQTSTTALAETFIVVAQRL